MELEHKKTGELEFGRYEVEKEKLIYLNRSNSWSVFKTGIQSMFLYRINTILHRKYIDNKQIFL